MRSALKQSQKYRRSGMIQDAGSSLWPLSSQSRREPWKDMEAAGGSGMPAVDLSEENRVEAVMCRDRGSDSKEKVKTSVNSDQEVATEVTNPQTKARSSFFKSLWSATGKKELFALWTPGLVLLSKPLVLPYIFIISQHTHPHPIPTPHPSILADRGF